MRMNKKKNKKDLRESKQETKMKKSMYYSLHSLGLSYLEKIHGLVLIVVVQTHVMTEEKFVKT